MLDSLKPEYKHYQAGDYLTDGHCLIRIRIVIAPSWTPSDIHQSKDYTYYVNIHPHDYCMGWALLSRWENGMPGFFFQPDGLLKDFNWIDKKLLNPEIW